MTDLWMAPIWAFGSFLILYLFHREKTKIRRQVNEQIHKERMAAIEKGLPYPELPPYNFEEGEPNMQAYQHRASPRMMVVFGVVLIMGGIGAHTGMLISENDSIRQNWSLGLIPVFTGIGALLGAWIMAMGRRDPK